MSYLFGPVLSRRLGLSMGVDLLKYKTCNLDCIYCELGRTSCLTTCRGRFVPPEKVLREIRVRRDDAFDHLTFAGSGEPTLSSDLGSIVRAAKELVNVPVAVITNSTLLASPAVRRELASADVILPSLDAATANTFQRINRPAQGLRIDEIIDGLKALRKEFGGEIWLEVMLVKGVNEEEADLISKAAESTCPDRIQLNTVVRPPAEPVQPLLESEMQDILKLFPEAELIPDWDWSVPEKIRLQLQDLLRERHCTLGEIATILDLKSSDAIKYCKIMERDGLIKRRMQTSRLCFFADHDRSP
ncbi:MAG: molybdenum cofactor biosynthesis protein A [Methanosaeta sp. PtaU1.Bin060]|nr:MAG: molybdenum cofactor biosynthesis protein A [Methanosaeta sp. PtaU1.Bin060]